MSDDDEEKNQSILVVEDDLVARTAIVAVLEALGYDDVSAFEDGANVLKVLDKFPGSYPVAIIDIFLTDMTAKHLASELPSDHGIQKILILSGGTADAFAGVRSAFEKRGISEIQTHKKPVTREMLQQFLDGA